MKNEAELCSVITKSLVNGYKIPDPSGMYAMTSKRAFDGIGTLVVNGELTFICWEAKFLKRPGAFNFNRIEPWQSFYLSEYSKAKNVVSYVIVGVDYGRADKRVFIFEWNEKMDALYKNGFSVHLKTLNTLPYNKISKSVFSFNNIIKYEDLLPN